MSNKERNEMKSNTNIDLASIPHPKDCYPVPAGATIPPYTPCWIVRKHGLIEWVPDGYPGEAIIGSNADLYLTPEPIATHPTPEDSPIIVNYTAKNGDQLVTDALAIWVPGDGEWSVVGNRGHSYWLESADITDWSPAVVTKSGHGIWDERDKRDRVDANGGIWVWECSRSAWVCDIGGMAVFFGSLNAFAEYYGANYLTGFADEEGGEE